ncbi:autoinducer binding domain-containing protein [Novosphingobium sp. LASN5T]|uniref:helix-turn-helix transcriptional regulator n=1 Tax=Novosphingobium sp. LASN5T TaxID=2491021 RepID=UPI000F5DD7A0|nr:autoinducer binding domain-containing protein [Novosphingobium sp. LASN5T]RQW36735.1 hypothetical protein EH199_23725 [Novosphingobium sp. LASN5T]
MSLHRLVEQYSVACQKCRKAAELFALTEAAIRELGFDRLALVHSLWFRRPSPNLIRLDNFGEYADVFIERRFYEDDPALLACQRTNTAFPWTSISALIDIEPRHETIFEEARRHGIITGMTLPVGVAGEPPGCCSFTTSKTDLPSIWRCRAAAFIGAEAFREARRLHGFPMRKRRIPGLSPRKLEVVRLAAIGKSDREISMILNLKRSTIETYMAQLRQAFDVYSRTQICLMAVRLGLIGYEDAMSGF